ELKWIIGDGSQDPPPRLAGSAILVWKSLARVNTLARGGRRSSGANNSCWQRGYSFVDERVCFWGCTSRSKIVGQRISRRRHYRLLPIQPGEHARRNLGPTSQSDDRPIALANRRHYSGYRGHSGDPRYDHTCA